jgi:S-formylglutathione hydrolase FrmB
VIVLGRGRRLVPEWFVPAAAGVLVVASVVTLTSVMTLTSPAGESVPRSGAAHVPRVGGGRGTSSTTVPTARHATLRVLHVASADRDVPIRDVYVYRPAVADSRLLPVVYLLHGVPGSAADFFNAGGAERLNRLFASGVAPFVLASPTGSGTARSDTEWADSVDGRDRVETYLINRVIPAVEGLYPRDAAHRVIAGFSMGGYGAANLALRHDNVFGGAASFEGYFHIDDPDEVFAHDPAVEDANNPGVLVQRAHDVRFLLADGASDTEPVTQGEVRRFAELVARNNGISEVLLAPGRHSWSFVLDHLGALARLVDAVGTSR